MALESFITSLIKNPDSIYFSCTTSRARPRLIIEVIKKESEKTLDLGLKAPFSPPKSQQKNSTDEP
ncbi:MAG: hypothetical protein GY786_09400 [Proteobacteria bacterium]|nr:hypothetical protein [Pseudomonadota bacterium]